MKGAFLVCGLISFGDLIAFVTMEMQGDKRNIFISVRCILFIVKTCVSRVLCVELKSKYQGEKKKKRSSFQSVPGANSHL